MSDVDLSLASGVGNSFNVATVSSEQIPTQSMLLFIFSVVFTEKDKAVVESKVNERNSA